MSDERRAVKRRLRDAGNDEANPWPEEPEEFDPGSLGPDVPEAPTFDEDADADDETVQAFWSAVLLANAGVFAVSIGPMLAYFQGRVALGTALFVVGAVALGRTYYIYRSQTGGEADGGEAGGGAPDDGEPAAEEPATEEPATEESADERSEGP